ncbi:MAG: YggS family pyridoxal phosphate-dependent enzyme [Clostridiales Family XIII bacterium]|jgi:pyridoxal phosphate enzyme (YggS family)|nr:YggS family pyridoxal phosphate-dependent enzyme [Clostridiales Family XIII bacterium]
MVDIRENIAKVLENIEAAAVRSGRNAEDITLICVSKTRSAEEIATAISCGQYVFGENKVQEIQDKVEKVQHIAEMDPNSHNIKWHMIGHLQRNKVKYIIDKVDLVHSVDSFRLAEELDLRAGQHGRKIEVLLQINAGGEAQKNGVLSSEAEELLQSIEKGTENIIVSGLMSVVPIADDPEDVRGYFREVKRLFDDIKGRYSKEGSRIDFKHLSMGMTHDYEIAIEEGATMVRVGTGIFGPRNYNVS